MLKHLSIKNYALINELEIDFSEGLNIITGETGAGKSILLGGLGLVLGKRADLGQIKDKSKKCVVEATILVKHFNLKELFKNYDLDYEDELIIRRELLASGKSRAFINDTPVNLEILDSVASRMIDLHSQNQTSQLGDTNFLFNVIDNYADNENTLSTYTSQYKSFQKISKEIHQLEAKQAEANRIQDYNSFLLQELNEITIDENQFADLEEQQSQLENTELIQQQIQLSTELINDEQFGALERLRQVRRALEDISQFGHSLELLKERVYSVIIELEDVQIELEAQEDRISSDPETLSEIQGIIEKVNGLLHKHHVSTFEDLMHIRQKLRDELETTLDLEERIVACHKEQKRLIALLNQLAIEISSTRQKALPNLTKALEAMLKDLGMPDARFNIQLQPLEDFSPNGKDHLNFKFTANKGVDFNDLKKVASGGEQSRIMLSLKSILAAHTKLPTLIFDEIDTGVSGEVADKIGLLMRKMSHHLQIISISHLPQIAAKGRVHFKVFKSEEGNLTTTKIKKLNQQERVEEIAQMLGGAKMSTSAIAHAKQLLN
jgi:DNA repair protein RecN (Recombination protein N)